MEEEEKVEVLVKPADDTLANEDKEGKDEIQMETPESGRINPRSATRRSAKSRLGLIRGNHGFHSVKLPAPKMERADTPEMIFNTDQVTCCSKSDTYIHTTFLFSNLQSSMTANFFELPNVELPSDTKCIKYNW